MNVLGEKQSKAGVPKKKKKKTGGDKIKRKKASCTTKVRLHSRAGKKKAKGDDEPVG